MARFFSPPDTSNKFLREPKMTLYSQAITILVIPAYVQRGRFVPGFQSGIGC